jgi:tetratricopeptide (TPR) repeat protein
MGRTKRNVEDATNPNATRTRSAGSTAAAPALPIWLRIALPVLVGLFAIIPFLPARHAEFVNWDDDKVVLTNPHFRGFSTANLRWMFTQNKMGHYHPLTWLSYAVDDAIGKSRFPTLAPDAQKRYATGLDPAVFHTTNLLLHAGVAIAVYFLATALLRAAIPATTPGWLIPATAAWIALIFAVHPLRVESVAWVTERRDLLSSLFLLPAVICYLRYAREERWTASTTAAYVGSILLLALSLLSKAWGMTLPLILLILDVYPLRRLGGPRGWTFPSLGRLLLEKLPHAALALGFAIRAASAQKDQIGTTKTLAEWGLADRFAQAFYGLAFYLWKTLIPTALTPLVQLPPHNNPFAPRYIIAAAAVAAGVVILFLMRKRAAAAIVAALCYVVMVSPVLGFLQSGPQLVADRYSYLACIPWAVLAGGGLIWLWRRRESYGRVAGAVAAAVVVVLAVDTWRQTQTWHDSYTLWSRAVQVDPGCILARTNLGVLEKANKNLAKAIEHYRAALAVDDRDPILLNNYASALREDPAQREEALVIQRRAISLMPKNPDLHFALADALLEMQRLDEALTAAQDCVRNGNPPKPKHYRILARVYMKRREFALAEEPLRRALEIERRIDPRGPGVVFSLNALGETAEGVGRSQDAVAWYRETLKIDPRNEFARSAVHRLGATGR